MREAVSNVTNLYVRGVNNENPDSNFDHFVITIQ
jgi:hypothetical protein